MRLEGHEVEDIIHCHTKARERATGLMVANISFLFYFFIFLYFLFLVYFVFFELKMAAYMFALPNKF